MTLDQILETAFLGVRLSVILGVLLGLSWSVWWMSSTGELPWWWPERWN